MKSKYTKELIQAIAKDSTSYAGLIKSLGLKAAGGNYKTVQKLVSDYDIDISHFTGQGHNTGIAYKRVLPETPIEMYLVEGLKTQSYTLKAKLIKKGLKECKCESCNMHEWLGKEIPLELHHINGDHYDNRLENLQLLCPNCHALTDNYRGKNYYSKKTQPKTITEMYPDFFTEQKEKLKKEKKINTCSCGAVIKNNSKNCTVCYNTGKRKVERPSVEVIKKEIKELGYSGTGRKYGVSDNAVRKWIKE